MSRILYELCGKDENLRVSPFVWRTRLALCRKELEFKGVPTRFTEKMSFGESGSKTVPVLNDDGHWVSDSWDIACYLEEKYPDQPSLFGGPEGKAYSVFTRNWLIGTILPVMFHLVVSDIAKLLDEKDVAYFRKTREARLGMTLEDTLKFRPQNLERFSLLLAPLRQTLEEQPFLSGANPLYPDFMVFGAFQWPKLCSPFDILEGEEVILDWFSRVLEYYRERIVHLETPPLL